MQHEVIVKHEQMHVRVVHDEHMTQIQRQYIIQIQVAVQVVLQVIQVVQDDQQQ